MISNDFSPFFLGKTMNGNYKTYVKKTSKISNLFTIFLTNQKNDFCMFVNWVEKIVKIGKKTKLVFGSSEQLIKKKLNYNPLNSDSC